MRVGTRKRTGLESTKLLQKHNKNNKRNNTNSTPNMLQISVIFFDQVS